MFELDDIPDDVSRPRQKKKRPSISDFDSPLEDVSRQEMQKVTGQKDYVRAGQYERQTITLNPEMRRRIKQVAREDGISLLGFYRFLLASALKAYEEGRLPYRTVVKSVEIVPDE